MLAVTDANADIACAADAVSGTGFMRTKKVLQLVHDGKMKGKSLKYKSYKILQMIT
jgi:hypothetical protein